MITCEQQSGFLIMKQHFMINKDAWRACVIDKANALATVGFANGCNFEPIGLSGCMRTEVATVRFR